MKSSTALWILFVALPCFAQSGSQPARHRQDLHQPTEIQAYSCAKGYAWFYADGHLDSCIITHETVFGDAHAPAGSWIRLTPDGKPLSLGLSFDTQILGLTCEGGGALGPAEGPATTFYPSGHLKVCWLAGDQTVQGVPCMGAGRLLNAFFRHAKSADAEFYEDGRLHSCTLSKNFGGRDRSEQFTQGP